MNSDRHTIQGNTAACKKSINILYAFACSCYCTLNRIHVGQKCTEEREIRE